MGKGETLHCLATTRLFYITTHMVRNYSRSIVYIIVVIYHCPFLVLFSRYMVVLDGL